MTRPNAIVDLRLPSGLPAHTAATNQLASIGPGETYELIIDIDPSGLMLACQEQLREPFRWEIVANGPPLWRLHVRREKEAIAADLADLLDRDHDRLDRLLRDAIGHLETERTGMATYALQQFTAGMRRHIGAENDVLGRFMVEHSDNRLTLDLAENMLRDHEKLLHELRSIEETIDRAWAEAPTRLRQFRSVLAIHEREERHRINPTWSRLVTTLTDEDTQHRLYARIAAMLDGREGAPPAQYGG